MTRFGSAGARDQQVSFLREAQTRRAGGGFDVAMAQLGDAWARVEWVRGGESERAGAVREQIVYRFIVLSEAVEAMGLTNKDYIVWNGDRYNIRERPRRLPGEPESQIIAEYLDQASASEGGQLPSPPTGADW